MVTAKQPETRTNSLVSGEFAVSGHQPFDKASDYVACIEKADPEKMARLVKLVGMLLQTKAYLFWSKFCGCCFRASSISKSSPTR